MEPVLPRRRRIQIRQNDVSEPFQQDINNTTNENPIPIPASSNPPTENAIKRNPAEIRLLSQGAYGCVFKPQVTCDGSVGDDRYVSKIQSKDEDIDNELTIGKKISGIEKFHLFYAPILESCPVSLNSIDDTEIKRCDILKQTPTNNLLGKYISTKIRYVSDKNLKAYLSQLPQIKEVVEQKLYSTFSYLLNSLKKLQENNLVHFDIKEKNIVYDEKNHSPIIIDFGLTFDVATLINKEYADIFYTEEFYLYWCIDIYIISYVIQIVKTQEGEPQNVSVDRLTVLVDTYFKNLKQYLNKFSLPVSDEEIRLLKEKHFDFFKPYLNQPWDTLVDVLIKPENYFTWDVYSLATTYLIICRSINIRQYESSVIDKLVGLWKSIVVALPNERKTVEKVAKEMGKILLYGQETGRTPEKLPLPPVPPLQNPENIPYPPVPPLQNPDNLTQPPAPPNMKGGAFLL